MDSYHFEVSEILEAQEYKFSKTMPHIPHSYTLKETWDSSEWFMSIVGYIRENGVQERWGRYNHHYLYLNGYKYWTMGAPIGETILINRAIPPNEHPYDLIAPKYDNVFGGRQNQEENKQLFKVLNITGNVLDIGCGTGLGIEWGKIHPEQYWGIDPSAKMLQTLMWKHPQFATRVRKCPFEQYYMKGFDTIFALYGTASYLTRQDKIRFILNEGGRAYLMYYKDDYMPVTYKKTGYNGTEIVSHPNRENTVINFNNYWIEVIEK